MKMIKRVIAVGVLATIAAAMHFANVSAVDPEVVWGAGGNVTGEPYAFAITRKITNVSNRVLNRFMYSIAADAGNPGTATGYATQTMIEFVNVSPVSNVATSTGYIDFSSTSFSALGDYFFTVSETASEDSVVYPLDTHSYKVVISVRNELDSNNVPTGKYLATIAANTVDSNGDKAPADGAHAFTSESPRTYIELSQTVSGNMANKDDCFRYEVIIDATIGIDLTISSNSTCTGSSPVVNSGGGVVYMKHGDTVTIGKNGLINQVPIGMKYKVYLSDAKGYQTTYYDGVASSDRVSPEKTVVEQTASDFNTKNKLAIRNDKYADPNTGILMNLWPFVLLVALAGAGTFIVVNKKAKKNAE
jgi:hypothetical protein